MKDSLKIRLTSQIARAVIRVVRAGLISGPGLQVKGKFVPGEVCVEQAISHALGVDHENDRPKCVGAAVNAFKIQLNDESWSSNEARTRGMERLAVAQLGSNKLDQEVFYGLLCKELGEEPDSEPEFVDESENPFTARMEALVTTREAVTDESLRTLAKSGLKVLMKMKSPGCKYLYLFKE